MLDETDFFQHASLFFFQKNLGVLLSGAPLCPVDVTAILAPNSTVYPDFQAAIHPFKLLNSCLEFRSMNSNFLLNVEPAIILFSLY